MALCDTLVHLMRVRGMSQTELADASGLTPAAVCRYVNGSRTPDYRSLERLAAGLAVPPGALFPDNGCDAAALDSAVATVVSNASKLSTAQRRSIAAAMVDPEGD